jgi:hypothetical protein
VNATAPGDPTMPSTTSTTVWMATPPRMFPIAISRFPASALLATMAISGRLVTIASRITPPNASPSPSLASRMSVASESLLPASEMAAPAARRIPSNAVSGSALILPGNASA